MKQSILLSDYAGISVNGSAVATVVPLANSWTRISVFGTNAPNRVSVSDQANDGLVVGATGVYRIGFRMHAASAGAAKVYETSVFTVAPSGSVITGATAANPVVVTAVAHGFSDGDKVAIRGVGGMVEINGRIFTVDDKADDTFELQSDVPADIDGLLFTAYTTGGTAHLVTETDVHSHMEHDATIEAEGDELLVSLNAGDLIELFLKGVTDASNITAEHLSLTLERVG